MLSERPSSFDTGVNFPPNEETFCRRKTFYVNADWQLGSELETAKSIVGQMYVECLEPLNQSQRHPIILIHGDFHTGQVSTLRSLDYIPSSTNSYSTGLAYKTRRQSRLGIVLRQPRIHCIHTRPAPSRQIELPHFKPSAPP